jgi:hypothetical protein
MKENPAPTEPKKGPESTGLALFALVGGFILLIMIIGWILLASRG